MTAYIRDLARLVPVSALLVLSQAHGQPLPPDWQKAVILIEQEVKVDDRTQHMAIGTGFLVGRSESTQEDKVYLVTAKHVLAKVLDQAGRFLLRFESEGGGPVYAPLALLSDFVKRSPLIVSGTREKEKGRKWAFHSEFDVGVIDLTALSVPKGIDYRVFPRTVLADKRTFDSLALAETDATFTIVYDSSFGRRLVRSGIISGMLPAGSFLVDTRNLPGDSGSPVILQPTLSRKAGTIQPTGALVIGLVSEIYSRMVPIGKFGNTSTDLLFPQPMNLSLVQPSYRILEVLGGLD
jgi:hypothetical protein